MAADDDLIVKVDSLMRRRVFVAGGAQVAEVDDLPVLTEIVTAPFVAPAGERPVSSERIEALVRERLFERLPDQRQALAEELGTWLDRELPQVVMRVLDGLTDLMVAQVTEEARAALLPRLQTVLEIENPPDDGQSRASTPV